jgi:hypothetical protein
MVRGAERPAAVVVGIKSTRADRGDRRDIQRLAGLERRQKSGQALRQHALAGTGRADEQDAVGAGGGDQQRTLGCRLSAHLRQIR